MAIGNSGEQELRREEKEKMVFIEQIMTTAIVILCVVLTGAVTMFIVMETKYKHRITIKECVGGKKRIINDKFRIKKDATGIWWKTRKTRALIPENLEAAEVTTKGKIYVEYYLLDGGTYVPAVDKFDPYTGAMEKTISNHMQPMTTSQRSLYLEQVKKAERDKKKSISEIVQAAIPYAVLIIILVCIMVFWGEFMQPAIDATEQFESVSENLVSVTDRLDSMINNKEIIVSQEAGNVLSGSEVPN